MSDSALDRLYSNMDWTRALCNAPEREQVYKLVLNYIAERQGYLPVEQELQQVLKSVEARTTRLVLVSSQVWQNKVSYTLHLLKECQKRQVPIFLVYDYHICNNKRFPAVFSVGHVHSAREWQLQDLQELCRTMLARPLLRKAKSPSTSALGAGMGLGSGAGGPSIPTAGSLIQSVAHPIGEVLATAAAQSSTKSVLALPPFPQQSGEAFGHPLSLPPPLPPAVNSSSIRQGELKEVAGREPEKAAGTKCTP
jgi:hypothetical protein